MNWLAFVFSLIAFLIGLNSLYHLCWAEDRQRGIMWRVALMTGLSMWTLIFLIGRT